jgi:hypothetical protein
VGRHEEVGRRMVESVAELKRLFDKELTSKLDKKT